MCVSDLAAARVRQKAFHLGPALGRAYSYSPSGSAFLSALAVPQKLLCPLRLGCLHVGPLVVLGWVRAVFIG